MLKKNMLKAINEQINAELYSAYLYMSMSGWCESKDLAGMANWMRVQAQEELFHASRFFDYINDRDGQVLLTAIDGPPTEWKSAINAFEEVLAHEQKVTARINKLVELAAKETDHTTHTYLQWFVNEQIEEEANARKIIGQLRLMGDSGSGLYLLDKELATRVFTMPTVAAP
jgi:ferritin